MLFFSSLQMKWRCEKRPEKKRHHRHHALLNNTAIIIRVHRVSARSLQDFFFKKENDFSSHCHHPYIIISIRFHTKTETKIPTTLSPFFMLMTTTRQAWRKQMKLFSVYSYHSVIKKTRCTCIINGSSWRVCRHGWINRTQKMRLL